MPLATALVIAAATYAAKANNNEASADENEDGSSQDITSAFLEGKTPVELLPLEQKLTIFEQPISTISFYDCSALSAADVKSIVSKMEDRVHDILEANPWLGGWLVSGKGVGSFDKTHRVWYDRCGEETAPIATNAPKIFQEVPFKDAPLRMSTPFLDYESILPSTSLVKNNQLIVNRKDEPLFRVTIILEPESASIGSDENQIEYDDGSAGSTAISPAQDMKGFALIVSMSHVCGDAHTYYRIYNMLLNKTPVTALNPTRELDFSRKVVDLMGRNEAEYISHITTDPVWAKLFHVSKGIEDNSNSEIAGRIFLVDRSWVGNIKAETMISGSISDLITSTNRSPMSSALMYELENIQNPTQSTNDILVSWFWNMVKPDVGMMAVNLRDRINIVSNDHVGNYNNPISYTPVDYKSPQLIRESLKQFKRAGVVDGFSTTLPWAKPQTTFSIVTNWSSFAPIEQNQVEKEAVEEDTTQNLINARLIRHTPLIFPKQMYKTMPKRMSFMVIFSSGDDLGCVMLAPCTVMQKIDSCGVVKEMIAQF